MNEVYICEVGVYFECCTYIHSANKSKEGAIKAAKEFMAQGEEDYALEYKKTEECDEWERGDNYVKVYEQPVDA